MACAVHLAQGEARVAKLDALEAVAAVGYLLRHRHHAKPLQVPVERHVPTLRPGQAQVMMIPQVRSPALS